MELRDYEVEDRLDDFSVGRAELIPDNVIDQSVQETERNQASIEDTWEAARKSEAMVYGVARMALDKDFPSDFNFRIGDHLDELSQDVPEEYMDIFHNARSLDHANHIKKQFLEEQKDLKTLNDRGWLGTGMQMGAAVFDEGNAALALVPQVGVPHKVSRIARALRVGAISAAENAAVEAFLNKTQHTREAEDVIYAGLSGFVLGAPLGYLSRGENQLMNEAARKAAENIDKRAADEFLSEQEAKSLSETEGQPLDPMDSPSEISHSAARNTVREHEEALDFVTRYQTNDSLDLDELDPEVRAIAEEYIDDPVSLGMQLKANQDLLDEVEGRITEVEEAHQSMGAAQTRGVETEIREDAFTPEELEAPTAKFGKLRYDMVGKLMSSTNPIARNIGRLIGEDAVGHYQKETASELASRLNAMVNTKVYSVSERAFRDWIKESKLPWHARMTKRGEFHEQVGEAIRSGGSHDPYINKVAEAYRRGFKTLLDAAKEANVKGFRDVADNPNYLPRLLNYNRVQELNRKFGSDMEKVIAEAMRRATPDIDDAVIKKMAKGYWLKAVRRTYGNELEFARPFSVDNQELVRDLLQMADVEPDEITNILAGLKKSTQNQGKISRAKRRTSMDETTSIRLTPRLGTDPEEVRIADLFDSNAERVFSTYSRQVSGHIAVAKRLGVRSKAEWAKTLERVRWGGQQKGQTTAEIESDLKRMQNMYDLITGRPLEDDPGSIFNQSMRLVRGYNFSRVMNQVGFAQLAEIGNVLSIGGIRATLRHIPEMKAMIKRMENGELEDEFMRELEEVIPLGTDRLRNPVATRADDFGLDSTMFGKLDSGIQHMNRFTADISGMAPVTLMLQKMSAKVVAQNFADMAVGGKGFSKQRLLTLGINDADLERISTMIRKHAVTEESYFGAKAPKLRKLNLDNWEDTVARDEFIAASYRAARRIVQENDFGNTFGFMHKSTGKLLTQFRSFMLVAWQKQTLHNLAMNDMAAWTSFMTTTFFGGMAYAAQTYINSIGREDQKEYVKERLEPATWGRQAFMRSGHASLLPAGVDTIWSGMLQQDPLFRFGRSTGLDANLITGNPTYDLAFNKGGSFLKLPSLAADNVDYSSSHFRNNVGILPFQNAIGVRNVFNVLSDELNLPNKSRND